MLVLTYKALHGLTPRYFRMVSFKENLPSMGDQPGRGCFRFSSRSGLWKKTVTPKFWNSFPPKILLTSILVSFWKIAKIILFQEAIDEYGDFIGTAGGDWLAFVEIFHFLFSFWHYWAFNSFMLLYYFACFICFYDCYLTINIWNRW